MLPNNDWRDVLQEEWDKSYFQSLMRFLDEEYAHVPVYPERNRLFHALEATSYAETKVVLLGQDPYHGPGQAHGLSFSVPHGVDIPPSLRNIYKELQTDLACTAPHDGCLDHWAKQGVLLLNTVLSVREGCAGSHQGRGWEKLTDEIINAINKKEGPVVFLLWGKHAESKLAMIDSRRHPVIVSAHPSPLSARRGFFGSRPFSRTNGHLVAAGFEPIRWTDSSSLF